MVLLKVVADFLIELSKIHRSLFTLIYKLSYPISPTGITKNATTCHYSPTRVVDNLRDGKDLGMRAMLLGTLRTTSFSIFLKAAAEELRCLTNFPILKRSGLCSKSRDFLHILQMLPLRLTLAGYGF